MDSTDTTQATSEFLMNIEKISLVLLELLKQAKLKDLPLSSLTVVKQVGEYLLSNILNLIPSTLQKVSKKDQHSQTALCKTVTNDSQQTVLNPAKEGKNEQFIRVPNAAGSNELDGNICSTTPDLSISRTKSEETIAKKPETEKASAIHPNKVRLKDSAHNLSASPLGVTSSKRKQSPAPKGREALTKRKKHCTQKTNFIEQRKVAKKLPPSIQTPRSIQRKGSSLKHKTLTASCTVTKLHRKKTYDPDQDLQNKYKQDCPTHKHCTNQSQTRCDFCHQVFPNPLALRNHKEDVHRLPKDNKLAVKLTCDLCNMSYKDPDKISFHIKSHLKLSLQKLTRSQKDQQPFKCEVCGKSLATLAALLAHKKRHQIKNEFFCDFCSETFTDISQLKSHRERHTNEERPYKCPLCGKGFRTQTTLRTHKMLHTGELPYECDICGKRFIQTSGLNAHKLRHTAEEEATANKIKKTGHKDNSLSCHICGRIYVSRSSLTVHMKVHAGVFDLPCDLCPKKFKTPAELRHHRRVHTKEKPYVCDVCNRAFSRHSTLVNHKRSHNAERPFLCVTCGAAFKLMNTLKKHITIHKRDHKTLEKSQHAEKSKTTAPTNTEELGQLQATELDLPQVTSHQEQPKQNTSSSISPEQTDTVSCSPQLPISEDLVPPPPPYPTNSLNVTVTTDNPLTDTSQPFQQQSHIPDPPEQKLYLAHLQPQQQQQHTGQLIDQSNSLLGLVPPLRPASPQAVSNQTNSANPLLSFSGHVSQRPQQSFTFTVRQPQLLTANDHHPSQQIHALGLFQTAQQLGNTTALTRNAILSGPLATRALSTPSTPTHQLLQLPARLQLTTERPLVTSIPHRSVQAGQLNTSSIDQPLYRLQNQVTRQPTPMILGNQGVLRQPMQTLVSPANLLLRPVDLLSDDDTDYPNHTSVQDVSLGEHTNLLQTPPTPSSPANFPSTHTGQTLVLLSSSHPNEPEEMLSLQDDTDPLSIHNSQDIPGVDDEDVLEQVEEEAEEDAYEDGTEREPTPNLLDLTNTTTYTTYYYY
ncbi:zinc finger protein 458 [Elysia marginata]|uniref:Zinc finger protein 458 n=1 Tax=Elysia marginata TaxID=1093978 RepID=A0AAV4HQM2_9GAST|nr:zinc finger protein 458 [Elysia marginata]